MESKEEGFSIGNFFLGMIASTLDLFGGLKIAEEKKSSNGKRTVEQNKSESSTRFHKKKSANFTEYVRRLESENFDFEKRMIYISEKIEAFEEKYPFGHSSVEQIYEDHVYKLEFEGEEEKTWFDDKYAFVKFVFPKHRSHFEFSENESELWIIFWIDF